MLTRCPYPVNMITSKGDGGIEMKDVYVKHYGQLIGKKVTKIAKEADGEFYGLIFNDGTIAWILQDPEGNGPGFLNIEKSETGKK